LAVTDGLSDGTKTLNVNQVTGDLIGNATTSTQLETSRTIGLTENIVGTPQGFDGTGNISIPTTGRVAHSITVCSGFRKSMRDAFDDANSNPAILADSTAQTMMRAAFVSYQSMIPDTYTAEIVPLNTYLTSNHSYTWSAGQLSDFNDSNILNGIPANVEGSYNMNLYDTILESTTDAIGGSSRTGPYYEFTFADLSTPVLPATFSTKTIEIAFATFNYDDLNLSDADFVDCLINPPPASLATAEFEFACGNIYAEMGLTGFFNSSDVYTTRLQVWFTQMLGNADESIYVIKKILRPESFTIRVLNSL
jgi:hypothetical protein